MRLAALQFRPQKAFPDASRDVLQKLIREAAAEGSDVIVCPEMATCGYVWPDAETLRPFAEESTGPTYQMLSSEAKEANAWIVCGFPERAGESLYNSAMVIAPDGSLQAVYRKILLFDADCSWAQAGTDRVYVEQIEGGLAPAICMDLNDDGLLLWLEEKQPSIVAFCTNWLEEQIPVHYYWSWRLQRYSGWFVAANSWGTDGKTEFCGQSAIFGPGGVLLAAAPRTGDGIVIADAPEHALLSSAYPAEGQ